MAYVRTSGRLFPEEHINAENSFLGGTGIAKTGRYTDFADGATMLSQAITITKRCLVIVICTIVSADNIKKTDIRRGAVNKTTETTISAINFATTTTYSHIQEAWEQLEPGTYTFDLVNTSGGVFSNYGSTIKIVAVDAS